MTTTSPPAEWQFLRDAPRDKPFLVWIETPDTSGSYDIWEYDPSENKPELIWYSWFEDGYMNELLYPYARVMNLPAPPSHPYEDAGQ
jgi:hypothetical protein